MPKDASKYFIPKFILAHFSHHVSTGVLVPLLPLVRESFNLNYFESGVLISSFGLPYGLAQVPMALLADRLGHLPIIILGLLGVSLASSAGRRFESSRARQLIQGVSRLRATLFFFFV